MQAASPSFSGQLNAVVETRNDQQGEHCGGNGATNDGRGHGPVKLAALTNANGHRHHAGYQSKGGHDDGTQALSTGRHEGLFTVNAIGF